MGMPFFTAKTAVLWSLLVIFARENEASKIQRREVLDAFKIYAHLDDVLAVSDINADGVLECVEAVRTEYQTQPKVATYLFLLKGHHGTEKRMSLSISSPAPHLTKSPFILTTTMNKSLKRSIYTRIMRHVPS
uniref:Putative lipocalin 19 n=1 Tax=Rhipicephalus microplus TaxID=6941 RepID=A0A6G5A476_RHIMP